MIPIQPNCARTAAQERAADWVPRCSCHNMAGHNDLGGQVIHRDFSAALPLVRVVRAQTQS